MVDIYFGDCLDIMPQLDAKFDAVICDPPYGKTPMDWDKPIHEASMWTSLYHVARKNTPIGLFGVEPFSSMLRASFTEIYKYDWYWIKNKKTNFLNSGHQPLRRVENISMFYWSKPTYNPQKTTGHDPVNAYTKRSDSETMGRTKMGWRGGGCTERHPDQCLYFPVINNDGSSPDGKRLHPLQKPVALLEYLVATYTNPGDTVLDFAAGSGSTAQACINLQRNCVLIERKEKYFEVMVQRFPQARVHG